MGLAVVPGGQGSYLELARTKTGRLFKKHLLTQGPLLRPDTNDTVDIDDRFVSRLVDNFKSGVCPIVQVPLADEKNTHTHDPKRNIGEVVDLTHEGNKVYAILDVRDEDAAERLGKTYLGASALVDLNYKDTKTGRRVGPTLVHSLVTNHPYLNNLDGYEEVIAASRGDDQVVLLATKEQGMELDELLAVLKDEHGIDVRELQAQAEQSQQTAELAHTLAGALKLSNGEDVTPDDLVGAVSEIASENLALTNRLGELERKDATAEVDSLVRQGRVLPAQRDEYVTLKLSQPDLFNRLVPEKPFLALSVETGTAGDSAPGADKQAEIDRILKGAAARYIRTTK